MRSALHFFTSSWRGWALAAVVVVVVVAALVLLPTRSKPVHTARKVITRASISVRMAGARTYHNVPYCGTESKQQNLDLYVPKTGASHPVVVFIHGGGWSHGDKTDPLVGTYGPDIVKQGSALASINYRLAPQHLYPDQNQDVSCALSFLYDHSGQYQLDRSRSALFGASAGGQLAAYAALAERSQPWHASIKGVIDFYGISDLTNLPPQAPSDLSADHLLGPHGGPDAMAASPVHYANQPAPPFLLFAGEMDHRVPPAQSQELAGALQAHGNAATLVIVNHAGHGFGSGAQPSVGQIRSQLTGFLSNVFAS